MPVKKPTKTLEQARSASFRVEGLTTNPQPPDAETAPSPAPSAAPPDTDIDHPVSLAHGHGPIATAPPGNQSPLPPNTATATRPVPRRWGATLAVSAAVPAPTVSPAYEALCRNRSPAKALQALLRVALDQYELMLIDGTFRDAPTTYSAQHGEVRTTRKISQQALDAAKAHFDPLGVEQPASLGRMIATAALAVYFDQEKQHR